MLYIMSQNGLRITDLRAVSVLIPDHDLEEEGVYKIFVNGMEFARYKTEEAALQAVKTVKQFIMYGKKPDCLQLPEDE